MGTALNGAIAGFVLGAVLFGIELLMVRRRAAERAEKTHQAPQLDDAERKQLKANFRFCLFLPPAFAFFAWLFWG
jgi:hypothetical protein